MILTCPACTAQYVLPDNAIGAKGRRVKCTTCDYTWMQLPDNVPEVSFEPVEKAVFSVPEYDDSKPKTFAAPKKRITPVVKDKAAFSSRVLTVGLGISLILILFTLGSAALFRPLLVARVPATALLFEKIGLPVMEPGKGLAFDAVKVAITKSPANKDLLSVSGKLTNNTGKDVSLPRLIIRLNSKTGWLKDWPVNLYGKALAAGKTTDFNYDLKDFPQNGQSVTLLFAD